MLNTVRIRKGTGFHGRRNTDLSISKPPYRTGKRKSSPVGIGGFPDL